MLWTLHSVFHSAPAEGPLSVFAMKLVFFRRTSHLVRYPSGITAGTWSLSCVFGGFAVRSAHCARLFLQSCGSGLSYAFLSTGVAGSFGREAGRATRAKRAKRASRAGGGGFCLTTWLNRTWTAAQGVGQALRAFLARFFRSCSRAMQRWIGSAGSAAWSCYVPHSIPTTICSRSVVRLRSVKYRSIQFAQVRSRDRSPGTISATYPGKPNKMVSAPSSPIFGLSHRRARDLTFSWRVMRNSMAFSNAATKAFYKHGGCFGLFILSFTAPQPKAHSRSLLWNWFFLGVLVILWGIRAESPQVRGRCRAFLVVLPFVLHTVLVSFFSRAVPGSAMRSFRPALRAVSGGRPGERRARSARSAPAELGEAASASRRGWTGLEQLLRA